MVECYCVTFVLFYTQVRPKKIKVCLPFWPENLEDW